MKEFLACACKFTSRKLSIRQQLRLNSIFFFSYGYVICFYACLCGHFFSMVSLLSSDFQRFLSFSHLCYLFLDLKLTILTHALNWQLNSDLPATLKINMFDHDLPRNICPDKNLQLASRSLVEGAFGHNIAGILCPFCEF